MNHYHQRDPQDAHRRQRRMEDHGDNLNHKIKIPEYHDSLRGDDLIEYQEIPDERMVKLAAM